MNQAEQQEYYENLYHLAQISVYKLNSSKNTLRHQLLIRNVLILSSNLITTSQSIQEEQGWLDACFDELMVEEDQDALMEDNNENLLVMAIPFEFINEKERTGAIIFM
ncbi:uncharacterized protein ATC70_001129 [Mucor velutinosus]|uniref:Uncharacterized protein n=1 Tax=Mucor velutinosus TaxID=708070 RepID=A0AAN7DN69_9FUNG|nr:hypothetical protein ATC70_001129 [Mucor velutinosus]